MKSVNTSSTMITMVTMVIMNIMSAIMKTITMVIMEEGEEVSVEVLPSVAVGDLEASVEDLVTLEAHSRGN